MPKIIRILLFWALLLSACSAIPAAPGTVPPATTEAPLSLPTTAVPGPKPIETVRTPHIEQPPDGALTPAPSDPGACGYQWAYQDLPELSSSVQQSVQTLHPEAQAYAFAFGENCLRNDGTIERFIPMETDFNITLPVSDLSDLSYLGEQVVKVMEIITVIPPEQIMGPRPGRVSLIFESGSEQQGVSFYINQFQELPPGLSSAEIFQTLQTSQ